MRVKQEARGRGLQDVSVIRGNQEGKEPGPRKYEP